MMKPFKFARLSFGAFVLWPPKFGVEPALESGHCATFAPDSLRQSRPAPSWRLSARFGWPLWRRSKGAARKRSAASCSTGRALGPPAPQPAGLLATQ